MARKAASSSPDKGSAKKSRTPGRTSRTVLLPDELIERAKNAVFWCRVLPGGPASFAALAETAMRKEVDMLEAKFNEGQPFPHGDLTPGPAPGVMERVWEERRRQAKDEGGSTADGPSGAPGGTPADQGAGADRPPAADG